MDHVGFVCDHCSEIVDNETKDDVVPYVPPEAGGVLALVVPFLCKALFEELVGEDAGLGEAIHSFSNFNVYPTIFVDEVS